MMVTGEGFRRQKTERTTYIGSLFEIETDGVAPEKVRKHIFAGANRIATISSLRGAEGTEAILYYHSDHLGSSNVITDQTGQQVQSCEYTPYGTLTRNQGTDVVTHKFTGKELDNTGLYFYGARYYDPEIGRFITADTIVQAPYDPQSLNRYSYCRNNPINYIDPSGHWSWKKFFNSGAGALVGGLVAGVLTGGFGFGLMVAGFWGGVAGGALTGGLEGGWKGALMGAAIGGALGAVGGWGISTFGKGFGYGMLAAGTGYTAATNSWDSFAGGFIGGMTGYTVGSGFGKSEQFQNWKAGKGFISNENRDMRMGGWPKDLPRGGQLSERQVSLSKGYSDIALPGDKLHEGIEIADNFGEYSGRWEFDAADSISKGFAPTGAPVLGSWKIRSEPFGLLEHVSNNLTVVKTAYINISKQIGVIQIYGLGGIPKNCRTAVDIEIMRAQWAARQK